MSLSGEYAAKMDSVITRQQPVTQPPLTLKMDLVSPHELCGELANAWRTIQKSNSALDSPYFNLEFTQAVARVRSDVEIAVFSDRSEIIAMLPFHRTSPRQGAPVGGRLNDSHGILLRNRYKDDVSIRQMVEQMMKVANLDVFAFHAMSQVDPSLKCFEFTELGSHFLDLSDGWDAYHQWARKNSVAIKRQKQKTRKMGREIGPIRFEFDCQDTDVLESLIELKRGKYQRSNTFDILSVDWASNLLREIRDIDQPGFKGLLSAIYAGDQLVAAHFGMLTDDILHYWFPVYDPQFHRYSPGTELLLEVAREACDRGVSKLDLGYGDDEYKFRFCNGHETVSCGQISFSKVGFQIAKQRYFLRQKLKGIPMKPLVKSVLRGVFPGFGQWNFK
jgi:CelD/BcsL family acetyltransferase involved in cellulose biosynthesis